MRYLFGIISVLFLLPVWAGSADVLDVEVSCTASKTCRFSVTVKHNDEGWKHYADRWEVLTPDGQIIAVRKLAHPHEHEQPFTRSLGGVEIPPGVTEVVIRAHDGIHGYGGREQTLALP